MAKPKVDLTLYGDALDHAEKGNFKAVTAVAVRTTSQAKDFARVDTGRLRGSLQWRVSSGRKTEEGGNGEDGPAAKPLQEVTPGKKERVVGIAGSSVLYAIYQEFGTRFMPPSPFLRPAIRIAEGKSVEEIRKILINEMTKGIKRDRDRVIRF